MGKKWQNNMQGKGKLEKCNINTDSILNSSSGDNLMVIDNNNSKNKLVPSRPATRG